MDGGDCSIMDAGQNALRFQDKKTDSFAYLCFQCFTCLNVLKIEKLSVLTQVGLHICEFSLKIFYFKLL